MYKRIKVYIEESYKELTTKVSWPTWEELQSSAIIVMVASLIMAIIVFVIDYVMGINSLGNDSVFWRGVLGFIYSNLI